jgi:hypothetical protein
MLRGMITFTNSELDLLSVLLKATRLDHSALLQKLSTENTQETHYNLELSEEDLEILLDLLVPETTTTQAATTTREKLHAVLYTMRNK